MRKETNFFIGVAAAIAVFSTLLEWVLPWWAVTGTAFLVVVFTRLKPGRAFLAGFAGVGISWLIIALWRDAENAHIMSQKMAMLLHLPGYPLFILLTVLLGGIMGGMGALSASVVRRII